MRNIKQWFAGLKVSQKLMLISIFFVMPDSLMLYFFITGINANIEFARWEKKGNEYQRPLEELLELIPQHASLAVATGGGEPRFQEALARKQAQIDAAFSELEAVDARLGADLQFTDEGLAKRKREHYRVKTVKAEWQQLKISPAQVSPESFAAQHRHLIADVRVMITHAGDLSNLILDPDLDSYYLMDATLLALPETQDRLAAVMALGETILSRRTISNPERQQLAIAATLLKETDLDRVIGSLQTALNEDENFYGRSATLQARVPSALQEYTAAAEGFIALTTQLAGAEKNEVTAKAYAAAGRQAREASFKLWRIADEELDTLLEKRIGYYEHRRTRSLMVAALALLTAVGLVTFITRSISGPLRKQADALRLANEMLQAEIAERQRSEAALESAQQELVQTARQAGMAEMATGVLHNVGNVLNSVNVASTCVADSLRKSKTANLGKVVALLRAHEADLGAFLSRDPKGRQLPGYLAELSEHLVGEQAAALKELAQLQQNIEHIKEVVSTQQSCAKSAGGAGKSETLHATDLVEETLRMDSGGPAHGQIQIIRKFEPTPTITVEKHKALQILMNLVRNAKQACGENGRPEKRLTLHVTHENDRVRIAVCDNGCGIKPENITRVFRHGFTTKKDGHGFGLHSGALAAKELGGALSVHSDGPGCGATFTLELPLPPPASNPSPTA